MSLFCPYDVMFFKLMTPPRTQHFKVTHPWIKHGPLTHYDRESFTGAEWRNGRIRRVRLLYFDLVSINFKGISLLTHRLHISEFKC